MLKAVAGTMAPPLPDMLQGVKLKRGQKAALQQFRDLFVCVRSEAARYGPDRYAPPLCRASQHCHSRFVHGRTPQVHCYRARVGRSVIALVGRVRA